MSDDGAGVTEWVYPVSVTDEDRWGYDEDVLGFFAGNGHLGSHHWSLSRRLHGFQVGDVIWVRASLPVAAFVGRGEVVSPWSRFWTG